MATLIGNNKPSMMAFPSALNRMGTFPIDISSVWYSYDEAVAYATQTNFTPKYEGQTGLPYVGQILTVVETAEDGTTSVTAYSIQNEAGDLAQVGTVTLTDEASIHKYNNDQISIYNFIEEGQEENKFPIVLKDEDGTFRIHWTSFDKKSISKNENGEIEIDGFKAANNITYPRKSADGKLEWVTISEVVEGATSDTVTTGDNKSIVTKEISGDDEDVRYEASIKNYDTADTSATNDYVPFKDATNGIAWKQVYTKSEVYNKEEVENKIDEKLTSVFKFKGVKTYKSELPTTGQAIGDVWLVIYDGDAPAEGEANTLPVSNSEYVWTSEKKWENLGDDIVDLSNYYTKGEVDDIVKPLGKVESVAAGTEAWTLAVTDKGKATETITIITGNASNTAYGVVKGDGTNVSIVDGVITVNEAGHAAEATHAAHANEATRAASVDYADEAHHAGSAAYATEASRVTNKLSIKIAEGEGNTVEFNGSEAKSVDLSIYAKSTDLKNYYTTSEADSNFMSETETNDAIAAVTDPLSDAIGAIKGTAPSLPEGETYVYPTLVELKAKDKEHDDNFTAIWMDLESMTGDISTANENASNAVKTANDALSAANLAGVNVGTAVDQAEEAMKQAQNAVDKATGAERVVEEVKGIAEEAKDIATRAKETADTAKKTADDAKAAAGVNAAAITALQTKDTEFTASIKALNEADSKHTTDIAKNAADIAGHTGTLTSYGERLGTVEGKVSTLEGTITGLEGAMHFVGETEVNPEGDNPVTIEGIENYQPKAGDVVLYNGLEFVYSKASTWVKFGDEGSYLTKTAADTNFLKKEDAATTYAPKSGFETLRDVTVPAAAKTAEWASVSGKPNLSYVEAKETTFSSTTTLTAEEGKIRNIEVYDADGERVILDIKRTSDLSYTLTAVGSTETLTVTYEVIHTVA